MDSCQAGGLEHEAPTLLVAPALLSPGGTSGALQPPRASRRGGKKGGLVPKGLQGNKAPRPL